MQLRVALATQSAAPAVGCPRGALHAVSMKAPARQFQLSDWYGEDWDVKKPLSDQLWVSPWSEAHYKIRQQEIEIEQCEFLLQQAIDTEDYAEADGLKTRVERLRSMHPIRPKEAAIADALDDGNFALAAIFQKDLDAVKQNLGLPKYDVGQAVIHAHRGGLRGVIIDVDLQCTRGRAWVENAGCLERGCALDYPSDEIDLSSLNGWQAQPFYTVMLDLDDAEDADAAAEGTWKWPWPAELAAWEVNHRSPPGASLVAEDALLHDPEDEKTPIHPELDSLFSGHDVSPHRGRLYRPTPRLRLWQQERQKDVQERMRAARANNLSLKKGANPYDRMGDAHKTRG